MSGYRPNWTFVRDCIGCGRQPQHALETRLHARQCLPTRTLKDRFAAIFLCASPCPLLAQKKEASCLIVFLFNSEFRSISFVRQLCQMKMLELFF
jgi:hypothetical protein